MTQKTAKKTNYLNNHDLMIEIHNSKISYSFIEDEKYSEYDIILDSVEDINAETIETAKKNRSSRISSRAYRAAVSDPNLKKKPKQQEFFVDPDSIDVAELVFRVMTYEHIPDDPERKRVQKTVADTKARVNFPPFKQYVLENGIVPREVVRSHWTGDLATGEFSVKHGSITDKLARMFIKLVERYSQRWNWRGYSYVDEMRGQALVQLSMVGLQFNEAKSENPFSYLTRVLQNSFTRVLNVEKGMQRIRDEIMIDNGHLPSYSRQLDHENEMRALREEIETQIEDDVND